MIAARRKHFLPVMFAALLFMAPAVSGQEPREDGVAPMGNWLEFRQATYRGKPILVHLRAGYERAVLMPEQVRLAEGDIRLPDCAIEIDGDIVGFYPQQPFERRPVEFIGLETGRRFTLRVRASETGFRQPLEIKDR
mgnify:CR=1 FL=1